MKNCTSAERLSKAHARQRRRLPHNRIPPALRWHPPAAALPPDSPLPDDAARGANLTSYTALGTTAVSNWAVAQKSDYEAIFTNLGSTAGNSEGTTYDGNVNAYITTGVGGDAISGYYWSATEKDGGNALAFISSLWGLSEKTNSLSVRPVLGF